MKYLVVKFGGTSVANPERIHRIAEKVAGLRQSGVGVAVVVSAMAHETDRLLDLCSSISPSPDRSEIDVVAATGETVAAALTSLAIQTKGQKAKSFLGQQLPILTDSNASSAKILSVNPKLLIESIQSGEVPVIAGFQGVDEMGRITTLGRGGSDTTAVAVAAALGGVPCEIYTDVNGVFTADPKAVAKASLLSQISYDFMIEAASLGAKVMHDRSVKMGRKYQVPIRVKSSFENGEGTRIGKEDLDSRCVTSQTVDSGVTKVSVVGGFVKESTSFETEISRLLYHRGIRCLGLTQGSLSQSCFVHSKRALDAVQLFHSNYMENVCK